MRARYERIRDLDFEPGTRWSYSNTNYLLLADVVERRSGKPFQSFLEERIFTPAKLRITDSAAKGGVGLATGYERDDVGQPQPFASRIDATGAGGLQTSPTELVRWAEVYRTGTVGGPALLRAQFAGAASTTLGGSNPTSDSEVNGAGISRTADNTLVHTGHIGGFQSVFVVSADRTTAVAAVCNLGDVDIGTLGAALKAAWM